MAVAMLAAAAPVFAQGEGGCDVSPGQVEKNRAPQLNPPETKPGATRRDSEANNHDENIRTGFGDRVEECA
jgi:hypothetical protein